MKYKLINRLTEEVVSAIDLPNVQVSGAKLYFQGVKQLQEKEFDKLFIVQSEKRTVAGYDYKWWEEEETGLDPF